MTSSPQGEQQGRSSQKGRPRSQVNPQSDRSLGGPLEEAALSAIPSRILLATPGLNRAWNDRSRGRRPARPAQTASGAADAQVEAAHTATRKRTLYSPSRQFGSKSKPLLSCQPFREQYFCTVW
jgi:hypothetical protein